MAVVFASSCGKKSQSPEEQLDAYCQLVYDWDDAVQAADSGPPLTAIEQAVSSYVAGEVVAPPPIDAYPPAIEKWSRIQKRLDQLQPPPGLEGAHTSLKNATVSALAVVRGLYDVLSRGRAHEIDATTVAAQLGDIARRADWARLFADSLTAVCAKLDALTIAQRAQVCWECFASGDPLIPRKLHRGGCARVVSSADDKPQHDNAVPTAPSSLAAPRREATSPTTTALPTSGTPRPHPLALGKALDPVLEALCDPATSNMKSEQLSEKTATMVGAPAGEMEHFQCGFKSGIGLAKWDNSLVDAGIYSISVFGDAIKPANQWSKNHFARLGAVFARPLLSDQGRKKLEQLVEAYASVEPKPETRWVIDDVAFRLDEVLAGDLAGKWVMILTPDSGASPQGAPVTDKVVRPVRATASSEHPAGSGYTYVALNLIDGDLNSSWQPASAKGQRWFQLEFDRDITVTSVSIANGFQATDRFGDEFLLNSRIAKARLHFDDNSDIPVEFAADARGLVRFDVPGKKTRSIRVTVDDTFPGTKWNDLAVSEVEVREQSNAR